MASPTVNGTAQVTTNASGSTTYLGNAPTGIVSGELLVAFLAIRIGTAFTMNTVPAGFNLIDLWQAGSNGGVMGLYWKLATGSEPASYSWVGGSSVSSVVTIFRVGGADTVNPAPDSTTHQLDGASTLTHTIGAVSPTANDTLMVATLGATSSLSSISGWGTMTQQWSALGGSGQNVHSSGGATEAIAATGSTGTRSVTTTGSGIAGLQSFSIYSPAAAVSAPEFTQTFQPISFY